jgi:four helix bundle protein
MRDHTRLRAFELADALAMEIYQSTATFPREEQFGLTSQMRRCAVSVASNIVEGCARHTQSDYIRCLDVSYGSIRELEYQISLATRLGFVVQDVADRVASMAAETAKVINGLIRSLRQQ